jgi:hypothetical protein
MCVFRLATLISVFGAVRWGLNSHLFFVVELPDEAKQRFYYITMFFYRDVFSQACDIFATCDHARF